MSAQHTPAKRDNVKEVLRAMALNYKGGHSWDHLDSETCVCAADRLAQLEQQRDELQALYSELLYSVARKFPDETRHETALCYIKNAEIAECGTAAQAIAKAGEKL